MTGFPAPVLADVDGTLVDSQAIQIWAWTRWASGHGLDAEPFVNGHGLRIEEKLERFAPHLSASTEVPRLVALTAACPLGAAALPGAARLLETTPRLALVTSGTRPLILRLLEGAGLPLTPVIVSAEDVKRGKPDPEPFLTGARRLHVEPADCIVLEDAVAGVLAGVAAGMTVIAVTTTTDAEALREAGAHDVVRDVAAFLGAEESSV